MALAPFAIINDPDEIESVWDYLDATIDERVRFNGLMESWLNSASQMLERYLNRPIRRRIFTDYAMDGNGRRMMYHDYYPIGVINKLRVFDPDFSSYDDFDLSTNDEISVDKENGRLVILPDAPIGRFTFGSKNVITTLSAGFPDWELDAFKDGVRDLVAVRWKKMARDPLELTRSDSIQTTTTFSLAEFDAVSHLTRQLINTYRKLEV